MKRARFAAAGRLRSGVLDEVRSELVDGAGERFPLDQVVFLPPVQPRTVIGLALNFADHAQELNLDRPEEPTIFFKPVSTLIGHLAPIHYPPGARFVHYEAELAVVIGRTARNVSAKRALEVVAGYTVANDVTCRDYITNTFRPPVRAKGWDTFGPIGPYLVDRDDVVDPGQLDISTWVNGELRQHGNTRSLVYGVPELIEFITAFMTLEKGDLILTGTPKGISPVAIGDVIRCEVAGLGTLENRVALAPGGGPR